MSRFAVFLVIALAGPTSVRAALVPPDADRVRLLAAVDSLHIHHHVAEAESLVVPLLVEARNEADATFVLPLAAKLGRLHASYGRPRDGEPLLREAEILAAATEDTLARCDALRWLGYAVEQQGRPDEARSVYETLRALAEASGDSLHEAWALVGLAYGARQRGDYEASECDYRRAADLFHALGRRQSEVWTRNGLGSVLHLSGRVDEARQVLEAVAASARDVNYTAVEAMAENNLGTLEYAYGDPGIALGHFRRARDLQQALSQPQEVVSTGVNILDCLIDLGWTDEADVLIGELLALCEDGGFRDRRPAVLARHALMLRQKGRFVAAAAVSRRVLALPGGVLDARSQAEHRIGLARSLARRDSLDAALAVLTEPSHLDSGDMGSLRGLAEARVLIDLGRPVEAASALDLIDRDAATEGHAAIQLASRMLRAEIAQRRGRPGEELAELMTATELWERQREAPRDPMWREQRSGLGFGLAARLAAAKLEAESARAAFDAVQAFKARTMAERIGRSRAQAVRAPVRAQELMDEVLAEGEVLIDIYLGRTLSLAFTVQRSGVRAVPLPARAEIEETARLLRDLLASQGPGAEGAAAAREALGLRLFGRLDLEDATSVIVVPDGGLHLLPFAALGSEDLAWSRIPSATLLAEIRGREASQGRGLLAFAVGETATGRPLVGAKHEVRDLAERYAGVDLRIAGQDPALSLAELSGYGILHLAGHARTDDRRPWAGALLLDPDAPDGSVSAGAIARLELDANLVVLSACETAAGPVLNGEGVLGFASAFLAAGAPAVVASLWPVDDATTARFCSAFYEGIAEDVAVTRALSRARRTLQDDPETSAPMHWAGFVVVGDGGAQVELVRRSSLLPISPLRSAFLGVAALLVTAAVLRRSRS